ncbi:uncharacterized protein [Nicotiana sylvestris]|uniref:uncharacterized protein n=1 Tax=Nicotiana sylvestris TaxID=4096 RepID=UPI00388C9C6F
MRHIENMFKQMMEKNTDSVSQLASHSTSIRNLEIQMGQISQALNTHPKGELPSDTVVNPNGGNNTGHAMVVTKRSGKGGNTPTSSQRKLVDEEKVVQEEEILNNVEKSNDEVWIDIDDSVEETQKEVTLSRDHIIDMPEPVAQMSNALLPKPPPPYPQRHAKKNGENQFRKFIQMMKSLSINVPLAEALEQIPFYAKFMKDLVTKKWSMNFETIKITHQVTANVHSMAPNLEDPDTFMIHCTIGSAEFAKALCDLKRPLGVIKDVLVRVDKFILPADFVILDCEVDYEMPIIVGRPFLATGKAILLNFDDDEMDGFVECVNSLQGMGSYTYEPHKLSLDIAYRTTPPTKPSIEEPPILELNPLPPHLLYEFPGPSSSLLVIHSSCLTNVQVDSTFAVLQKRTKNMVDIAEYSGDKPCICMHKINLEEGDKPSIEHQKRLNEAMQ